ncbi:MAG: hypothetical protein WD470_01700 [Rhodospirillaceae bacterium]
MHTISDNSGQIAAGQSFAGQEFDCALHPPPGARAAVRPPEWLVWLRALRSQVLHDGGRRPAFGPGGGAFGDADPADGASHHLVLSSDGLPVATLRLLAPATSPGLSVVRREFGAAAFDAALGAVSVRPRECLEAGRLVLHGCCPRDAGLRLLLAGAWAFAAATGARGVLSAAGTGEIGNPSFALFGARPIEGISPAASERFAEDLRLVWMPIDAAAAPAIPELGAMRRFVARELSAADAPKAAA